jgi:hypothetical protein
MNIKTSLLVATAAALIVAGCGGSSDPVKGNAATGNGTVVAQGGGATITKDAGGTTTVTTNQGTAQIHAGAPTGALPGGLPAYPNAQAAGGMEFSGTAGGQQGRVVTFTTADQPGQVLDFYANAANQAGFQTLGRTEVGPSHALALMKGNEAVTVTTTGAGGQTQVQIAGGTR